MAQWDQVAGFPSGHDACVMSVGWGGGNDVGTPAPAALAAASSYRDSSGNCRPTPGPCDLVACIDGV